MHTSLIAALCISGALAYLCRRLSLTDQTLLYTTATILAGATAADIRMLCRRLRPMEIAGVRGSGYFIRQSLCIVLPYGLLGVAPLIWLLLHYHGFSALPLLSIITGVLCGFCASTIVSPTPRNIGGQFITILACITLVFCCEQFINLRVPPTLSYLIASVLLVMVSIGIEHKRNPYYWRSSHA